MQVVVDGLLVNYEKLGSGPVILILHGWGDSGRSWQQLQKNLSKKYTVIIPDLPGFGGSDCPNTSWDLTDYAQFVAQFLKKIGAKEPMAIIGHSNGGAIAIRGLGQDIITADRLVLLASSGMRNKKNFRKKVTKVIAKTGKVAVKPLPARLQHTLRSKLYASSDSDMLVVESMKETFVNIVADDVQADAARILTPTLLMYGENDTDTPVAYGELFNKLIDGSTLKIVGAAGHFIYQDAPEVVERSIKDFLK